MHEILYHDFFTVTLTLRTTALSTGQTRKINRKRIEQSRMGQVGGIGSIDVPTIQRQEENMFLSLQFFRQSQESGVKSQEVRTSAHWAYQK